jgi:hypothetical protein
MMLGCFRRRFSSLILVLALAGAADLAAGLEPPSPFLTVTGRATIYHGDIAGARERAVRDALRRAVEQYAGLRIEASTLISKGELIRREVKAHTLGHVSSFKVLEEGRDGAELVVRVRVTVAEKPVAESFGRMMSATTTLLLVHESNLGEPIAAQLLPSILSDPFFTASLVVPPQRTIASAQSRIEPAFYGTPDPETARELGLRYMAGVIVVVRAETEQLYTGPGAIGYQVDPSVLRPIVAASGSIVILSGQTGGVIASRRFDDIRGDDATDPKRAGIKALDMLGQQMRELLVESLSAYIKELGFPLRVVVKGPAAAQGATRIQQVLETTRWVERVDLAEETPEETILQVTCGEKPVYIVEELRQAEDLQVIYFSAPEAVVEVK